MIYKHNFFIITGGPGAGKTTLLETLAKQGFPYVPEVAREIIREQVSQNGDALPWANIPAYIHLMLSRSVESFEQHQKQESVLFFDRGIPDTLAYAHLIHQPILRTPHPSIPISRTPTCRSRLPLQSTCIYSSTLARNLPNRFRT